MMVKFCEYPNANDWFEVKKRALVTVGKNGTARFERLILLSTLSAHIGLVCIFAVTFTRSLMLSHSEMIGRTNTTETSLRRMKPCALFGI